MRVAVHIEKMDPGFADFPNFAQGFGCASREAISEAREFSKIYQVGFRKSCDTGVVSGSLLTLLTVLYAYSVAYQLISYIN